MEAKKSPDEFKMGMVSESASGDNIGKWDKPGIKSDRQKYQMIDENSFPGYKSDRSSNGNIDENVTPGIKNDSSVKGAEAMREMDRPIFENARDSEIIISEHEHLQDLENAPMWGPMSAGTKRADFNAGALTRCEVEQHEDAAQPWIDLNAENEL